MRGLLDWWNSLSQGVRDGIISTVAGGAGLAVVAAVFKLSGRSLKAGLRKLVGEGSEANQPLQQQRHEIVVKVEQPPPRIEEPKPEEPKPEPRRPAGRASHNVPRPPLVGFVERSDKDGHQIVLRLKEELAPRKDQLVALWGDGGVGKTTIAAETARALIEAFSMDVVWINADGRPDFALSTLLDEIAAQLGEPEIRKLASEPKKDAVRELIDHSDMPLLVVLDNLETISRDEQKLCAEWIARDAHCPALVTTRGRVDSARNVPIDVMSASEANEFLNRLIAQAQNSPGFEHLNRDSIIEAADGNPLVMQWVIAQIDLAQHPSDVLDDLAHGVGDAAQRVFDRSFDLPQLGADGRDTLLALSLFAPSASRPALAEVSGFGNNIKRLRDAVKSLAALCLIETRAAEERWIIKGLTRDLARARLSKDGRAAKFRRRFVAYFADYAELHSRATKEDFDAIEVEKDNVLSAMDVAFETKDWERVMRTMIAIGEAVSGFLVVRGYWDEAIQRNEQALNAATVAGSEWFVGAFANALGAILADRGEYSQAKTYYERAVNVARKLDAQQGLAATLHQLGILALLQGEIDEARRLCDESIEIEKKLGNENGIARSLHQLGRLAEEVGETDEARRLFKESLQILRKLGDQDGIAITLHELGRVAQGTGELDEAQRLYNESLEIKKKLGDQSGIASTLHQLGRLAEDEGHNDEAARMFREALSIFEKLKSPYAEIARRSLERAESEMK